MMEWVWDKLCGLGVLVLLGVGVWLIAKGVIGMLQAFTGLDTL